MSKDIVYELTRGFAYRRISHVHQSLYTTTLPVVISVIVTIIYLLVPDKAALLGKDGVLSSALSIISTLPGFYFAGLAAVATFGGIEMDKDMPDPAPHILIRHKGVMINTKLSRRKYLSYLFSYLVVISFALCCVILTMNALQPAFERFASMAIEWKWGSIALLACEGGAVLMLLLLAASLTVTTLQGLFFLSERIHQP